MADYGSDWRDAVREHRSEKAATFASPTETPLGETAVEDFEELEFFPIEEAYRVSGRLEPATDPEPVSLEVTRGPPMTYERIGRLGVTVADEFAVLDAFRASGVESLLVPFRDPTNGAETWSEGRYLTISGQDPESGSRIVETTIDFNLAYHPLCVYDPSVRSAVPPTENELPVPIRAGERLPGGAE